MREVDLPIGPLEVQAGRQLAVLKREHGLDQPGNAGRAAQMPDVGLDRADGAGARASACVAEDAGQRPDLDGITKRRASAVGLDIVNGVARKTGSGLGGGYHGGLAFQAGGGEADLDCAVVVDRRAANHCRDGVAVGQRMLEPLEHNHTGAAAKDRALGLFIERPAVPVARGDPACLIAIAGRFWALD